MLIKISKEAPNDCKATTERKTFFSSLQNFPISNEYALKYYKLEKKCPNNNCKATIQLLMSVFFRKKQARSWQWFVKVIPRRLMGQKSTLINWNHLVGAAVAHHPHQRPPQLRVASNQTILSPEWGYFSKEAPLKNQGPIHRNLKGGKIR